MKKQNIAFLIIIVVVIFAIIGILRTSKKENAKNEINSTEIGSTEANSAEAEFEIVGEKSNDIAADIIEDALIAKFKSIGFNESESNELRKIFIKCGVTNIATCEPVDSTATIDGLVSYRAEIGSNRVLWFTIDKRELIYIALNGETIYDIDEGGFVKNYNDIHVPEIEMTLDQKQKLRDLSETILDKYFKYTPYYDAWGFARNDDNYMSQCEAYAKNDLGTKKYVKCKVWFEKSGDTYKVTNVYIDGQYYVV